MEMRSGAFVEQSYPSCQFDNLPLVRVDLSLRQETPREYDLEEAFAIRDALKQDLPEVRRFKFGQTSQIAFSVNDSPGLTLGNPLAGLTCELTAFGVQLTWSASESGGAYPRFATMAEVLRKVVAHTKERSFQVAVLAYMMTPQSHGNVADLLTLPGVSSDYLEHAKYFSVARQLPGEIEHRIEFEQAQNTLQTLVVSGGVQLRSDEHPVQTLVSAIHPAMQTTFAGMLTEQSRDRWGFTGIR